LFRLGRATTLGLIGILLAITLVHAQGNRVGIITQLDPTAGELPEGLAADPSGNLYFGLAPTGEIQRLTASGAVSTFAQLPVPDNDAPHLVGLRFNAGQLYAALFSGVAGTHGVWRVSADGSQQALFAPMPLDTLPNDIQFWQGEMFVSDSLGGAIWKVTPGGQAFVWTSDPLLLGSPDFPLGLPVGANGMAFQRAAGLGDGKGSGAPSAHVYVMNTSYGRIVRVPIEADGTAGAAEVWLERPALAGADGVTQDAAGNFYVALLLQDRVVRIGANRDIVTVAEGAPLDAPASPEFRGNALYVTNFAVGRALGLAPGVPAPSLARIDLGS